MTTKQQWDQSPWWPNGVIKLSTGVVVRVLNGGYIAGRSVHESDVRAGLWSYFVEVLNYPVTRNTTTGCGVSPVEGDEVLFRGLHPGRDTGLEDEIKFSPLTGTLPPVPDDDYIEVQEHEDRKKKALAERPESGTFILATKDEQPIELEPLKFPEPNEVSDEPHQPHD